MNLHQLGEVRSAAQLLQTLVTNMALREVSDAPQIAH